MIVPKTNMDFNVFMSLIDLYASKIIITLHENITYLQLPAGGSLPNERRPNVDIQKCDNFTMADHSLLKLRQPIS